MKKDNLYTPALANIKNGIKERQNNVVIHLPEWMENKRGAPNSFLRSALFAAIQSKDRRMIQDEILASQDGITVKYTGIQLNQIDLDVWEAIVHKARDQPLGAHCVFSAHELLKVLGLPTGNSQHKSLHRTIMRLIACAVEITHNNKSYAGSLIKSSMKDEISKHYGIELNKELINLFGENQWTALYWEQRKKLYKQPLAQSLHAFYSSHRKPFSLKLKTIHGYSGSQNKDIHGFKRDVRKALTRLVEIGFLSSFRIDEDMMVHVERALPTLTES